MSGIRRRPLKITNEMFDLLWENFPHDDELISARCLEALYTVHVPNPTGHTQSGIRIYGDDGFMGSGYTMVHHEDAKKLDWALDNGYVHKWPEEERPFIWDENPERERLQDIKRTLSEWI